MGLFKRRAAHTAGGARISDREARRADTEALRDFVRTRTGVEAFIEPATRVTQATVLMVAADGEWTRKKISSAKAAAGLARELRIPIYDANRVGYPDRMRQYNQRVAGRPSAKAPGPAAALSPSALAALMVLEKFAESAPIGASPSTADLSKLWKQARAKVHPDRRGGDRSEWDRVEEAARTLNLS